MRKLLLRIVRDEYNIISSPLNNNSHRQPLPVEGVSSYRLKTSLWLWYADTPRYLFTLHSTQPPTHYRLWWVWNYDCRNRGRDTQINMNIIMPIDLLSATVIDSWIKTSHSPQSTHPRRWRRRVTAQSKKVNWFRDFLDRKPSGITLNQRRCYEPTLLHLY